MTKKPATIFDLLAGITNKKITWDEWPESDQKKFSVYIINRWLSMREELVDFVNELQPYTVGLLSPRETYRVYYDFLPAQQSYAKYIKGSKEDKFDSELIEIVAKHFLVSKSEAIEYIELLDHDACDRLLSLYGYSDSLKKKMLKSKK
jgi:hypothetical protein